MVQPSSGGTDRPTLTACLIARNEERSLPGCLASLVGLADEIVVVDTGSTDQTGAIAEAYGAKTFHFPFSRDFAQARNQSLAHATGHWVLVLDADEVVPSSSAQAIRDSMVSDAADAYAVRRLNHYGYLTANTFNMVRLFRRAEGLGYTRRVHETIVPALKESGHRIAQSDITIEHLPSADASGYAPEGNRLYVDMLLETCAETPDPMCPWLLALEYAGIGQLEQALRLVRRGREAAEQQAFALYVAGQIYRLAGMVGHSREVVERSLALQPMYSAAALRSILLFLSGDDPEALAAATEAVALSRDAPTALLARAVMLEFCGRREAAVRLYRRIRRMAPVLCLSHSEDARPMPGKLVQAQCALNAADQPLWLPELAQTLPAVTDGLGSVANVSR